MVDASNKRNHADGSQDVRVTVSGPSGTRGYWVQVRGAYQGTQVTRANHRGQRIIVEKQFKNGPAIRNSAQATRAAVEQYRRDFAR